MTINTLIEQSELKLQDCIEMLYKQKNAGR